MKRQWIAALGVFAWSVEAHSAGEPSYQFDDLLAERIVVQIPKQPAKAELVLHVEGCEAKIPVGAGAASVELDRKNTGKCSDRIFKESTPHMLSLDVPGKPSITVSPPQVAPEKARVLFADGSAQGAQALPANSLLFVFTGEDQNPWIKVPLDEGKFKIPESVTSHVKQGAEVVYYLQTGLDFNRGKFSNDQLVQNGRSGTDSSASRSNSPSTLLPKGEPMRCERGNVPASTLVICVDFLSAEAYPRSRTLAAKSLMLFARIKMWSSRCGTRGPRASPSR